MSGEALGELCWRGMRYTTEGNVMSMASIAESGGHCIAQPEDMAKESCGHGLAPCCAQGANE